MLSTEPVIFRTPELFGEDRAVLALIDELRGRLRYQTLEARRWVGFLRRDSLARNIRGSNSIEGYEVSLDDAVAVVHDEEPLNAEAGTRRALLGYRDAMTYILQLAGDPYFSCSLDLIRSLHFIMLRHDLDMRPGRWRVGPVLVYGQETARTVYEGPDPGWAPALMTALVASLQRSGETPALVRAGMAHLNLAMIHPFRDGNGRMARALQTLILVQEGILAPEFCSIEEYLGRHQQAYYDVLAEVGQGSWQPRRDAYPWIRFVLTAHYRQARLLLHRSQEEQRVWDRIEREVAQLRLPERALPALAQASGSWRVRRASYAALVDVPEPTATRDLKALSDAGLLVPHGEKSGRHYTASADLRALRREIRRSMPDADRLDPYDPSTLTT